MRKKKCRYTSNSISLPSSPFLPLFNPSLFSLFFPIFPFLPSVSLPYPRSTPQIQLGILASAVSSPTASWRSSANKQFVTHCELKITQSVIALLHKFSDNQICIVTRVLALRHAAMVLLRKRSSVWHNVPLPALAQGHKAA